jgi:hypothetical protein
VQVGKSAFVRAMLQDMGKFESSNFDPAAMSNGRYLPVVSAMPGTTLGIIPLQAFASGGTLYGEQCHAPCILCMLGMVMAGTSATCVFLCIHKLSQRSHIYTVS